MGDTTAVVVGKCSLLQVPVIKGQEHLLMSSHVDSSCGGGGVSSPSCPGPLPGLPSWPPASHSPNVGSAVFASGRASQPFKDQIGSK